MSLERLNRLTDIIKKGNYDGILLVKNERIIKENVRYISGFSGSTAYLVITPEDRILITDDRYLDQASIECPEFKIVRCERPFTKKLLEVVKKLKIKKLAYEINGLTIGLYKKIDRDLEDIELVETENIIENLRAVKSTEEIELIAKAAAIAGKSFEYILDFFKPGVREKDIALEFEFNLRKNGADGLAFDLIIGSGERSTHQHGVPSEKKIENGDFVVMDFGALYHGYRSDITRTFIVGKATPEQKKVYRTVQKSQKLALDLLRAGVKSPDVCSEARKIIEDAGYGNYTGYGLGHGVGLEIHEEPYVRAKGDLVFLPGHVITIEPGIYISGWGGVRIEDTVVIEEEGCKILTPLSKELIELY
jgi:Xaa-Pro aminopeptidase